MQELLNLPLILINDYSNCNYNIMLKQFIALFNHIEVYLNDICHNKEWEAEGAYIVSPGYPKQYPSNTDCSCSMVPADQSNSMAQVLTLEFNMAPASPSCTSWVEFGVPGAEEKLCGSFTRRFSGREISITLHTTTAAEKGFLLYAYG